MRDRIINEARSWIGTPWRHIGRNRKGLDCIGLGVVVAREVGLTNYDVTTYGRDPTPGLIEHFRRVAVEIPIMQAMPGDFYVIKDGPYPYHVAFCSERDGIPHIIHANARRRMVIEEPYTDYWQSLTIHAFRLKGVK